MAHDPRLSSTGPAARVPMVRFVGLATMVSGLLAGPPGGALAAATTAVAVRGPAALDPASPKTVPPIEHASEGFAYGLRAGLSVPWGKSDRPAASPKLRSGEMRDLVMLRVPIWLDLGYQVNPSWWFGIQTQLGLGWTGNDCPDAADCHFTELRLGAQVLYTPRASGSQPWVGASVGWESLWSSMTRPVSSLGISGSEELLGGEDPDKVAITAKELLGGPQLTLQGGLQFPLEEGLTIGPFVSTAVGAYIHDSFRCPGICQQNDEVEHVRVHGWVSVGLRMTHGP